jgi:hypothetical protein
MKIMKIEVFADAYSVAREAARDHRRRDSGQRRRARSIHRGAQRRPHPVAYASGLWRQLDSKAPGHPEYHWVSGVETTIGPLGQGVAKSVGMAIGQKWLASHFNQPGFDVFDYHIYTVCGAAT